MRLITGIFLVLSIFCSASLYADKLENLYPLPDITFQDGEGNRLDNAFAGGMLKPQFSNIDLNGNGRQDLFVYDRHDGKVMTFLNREGDEQFVYAPQYIDNIPELRNFALLRDFNNNGRPDLFTYSTAGKNGIRVYENTSENGQLSFELYSEQLMYEGSGGSPVNIFLLSTDIPVIDDINQNNQIDILTFGPVGTHVNFYKNVGQELHDRDSLTFHNVDACWGRFEEGFTSEDIDLGIYYSWCNNSGKNKKHAGATMTTIDMDGTGDKDLILGDVENRTLKRLVNGKNSLFDEAHPVDTMIEVINNFPPEHPIDIGTMPATYYVDVTGNGIRDLLAAPNDRAYLETINQVWWYENTGEDNLPEFEFRKNNFLQNTMIDVGHHSSPAFFDFNGNGLSDLVVATGADRNGKKDEGERLVLYINEGTAERPEFRLEDPNFLNITEKNWNRIQPAFGDITGNGAADLLLGRATGDLVLFENEAQNGEASFASPEEGFANIQVNGFSAPHINDLTENGANDLLIGKQNGEISFYENDGDGNFQEVTDHWGKIKSNATYDEIIYDENNNPVDTVERYFNEGTSAPVIADITGDGEAEVIVGSMVRELLIYQISENPEDSFQRIDDLIYSYTTESGGDFNQGEYLRPAVMNDGEEHNPYLFIGNKRGGLFAYGPEKQSPPTFMAGQRESQHRDCFTLYPNPASDHLTISSGDNYQYHEGDVAIFTLTGQTIEQFSSIELNREIDISSLNSGTYFVKITTENCSEVVRLVIE